MALWLVVAGAVRIDQSRLEPATTLMACSCEQNTIHPMRWSFRLENFTMLCSCLCTSAVNIEIISCCRTSHIRISSYLLLTPTFAIRQSTFDIQISLPTLRHKMEDLRPDRWSSQLAPFHSGYVEINFSLACQWTPVMPTSTSWGRISCGSQDGVNLKSLYAVTQHVKS